MGDEVKERTRNMVLPILARQMLILLLYFNRAIYHLIKWQECYCSSIAIS